MTTYVETYFAANHDDVLRALWICCDHLQYLNLQPNLGMKLRSSKAELHDAMSKHPIPPCALYS